jgi:RND family efflux transporter MFP subunit
VAVAALVFVLFVVRVGQAAYERLRPSEAIEARPVAVEVLRVEPRTFEYTVPVAGTLAPVHSVDVFPKVGGRVMEVFVGLGDEVREGDPLADVEAIEYGIMAKQADAGLAMAEQAAAMAERSLDRLDSVHERLGPGALSQQEYDEAKIQVEGTLAQRDLARLQRSLARQVVGNATMRAPLDGIVTRVYARVGGMVGQEYPAFHVDDASELVVRCQVGDLDLPYLEPGQEVRLWTDALPDVELAGTVTAVSPSLDPWTRRAPIEVSVDNADGHVAGNLFARGEVIVRRDTAAIVLPLEVVQRTEGEATVQLARGEQVAGKPVSVLWDSGSELAVDGLAPGDLVIVPGPNRLAEGERVAVVDSSGTPIDVAQ